VAENTAFDRDEVKTRKKKWEYKIKYWYARAREGVWIPTAVATGVKRTFTRFAKSKEIDTKTGKLVTVMEEVEELVYAHHGYRPKLEGEKDTRKAFFFRGARVWRDR
jgi:hypothetical protein